MRKLILLLIEKYLVLLIKNLQNFMQINNRYYVDNIYHYDLKIIII